MKYTTQPQAPTQSGPRFPESTITYLKHGAQKGNRNAELYKAAQQFSAAGIPVSEATTTLTARATQDGLRPAEIGAAIHSAYKSTVVTEPIKSRHAGAPAPVPAPVPVVQVHKDDFITALQAAFDPGDYVAICNSHWQDDKFVPDAAMIRTRAQWEEMHIRRPISEICGSGGGGYMGINPLRSVAGGRKNDNVSSYRHVLAEFDDGDVEEQRARLEKSGLPITLIVSSGKRSVHGWIRVDAKDKDEWDARRDEIFKKLGCDPKNNDPARVSRCPGVLREVNGILVLQALLATKVGPKVWPDANPLPPLMTLGDLRRAVTLGDGLPDLIQGCFSVRSKMMIAGPSKARKSWALLDLALSIASGTSWLGMKCTQGKVIFIDGELHNEQILKRISMITESRLLPEPAYVSNMMFWPMRGQMREVTELMAALMETLLVQRPIAIFLDPIYKLLGDRDENAAGDVNGLLNELEKVASTIGCSIFYSHHFAKGDSNEKATLDRASGSGVWARDPDCIVMFTPPPKPKKDEPEPEYDFNISITARGHAPIDPFEVTWSHGHFSRGSSTPQYTLKKKGISGQLSSAFTEAARFMPALSKEAAIEWIRSKSELPYEESVKLFDVLAGPAYRCLVCNESTQQWSGTDGG